MAAPLLDPARAVELVLEHVSRLESERIELADALGRVLADDVVSPEDVPAFDTSAMDGFAVRARDTAGVDRTGPARLRIVDESRAGHPASRALASGEAIRISTGAVPPDGADAVVRVEDTAEAGDAGEVEIRLAVEPGRNQRRAGDDIRAGATVLLGGTPLGAAELGVLASVGEPRPRCVRQPRVHVLCTGDELVGPADPLPPGGVRNSNAHTVPAQAGLAGAQVSVAAPVADDRDATVAALRDGLAGADALVVCGGVSVGPHDHVKPALAELGVEEVFWRVALKPGKPTWFGVAQARGRPRLVFGLPGNPVSAMVTFHLFVRPALRALQGAGAPASTTHATIDADHHKAPGRMEVLRCTTRLGDDGWHVRPTGPQGSHVLTSMLGVDALALLEPGRGDVRSGEQVAISWLDRRH